jgi:hypothetical protein
MKSFHLLAALALAAAAGLALASERREVREVAGFNALVLSAPVEVDIVQGDKEGLVLEGDEARLAEIETVVEDGKLKIRTRTHGSWNWTKVRAHVQVKNLDRVAISGSADVKAVTLRSADLEIAISGSGDVGIGTLSADRLRVSIAGSGDVRAAGKVDRTELSIAGSGDVKTGSLEAREARISITGAGSATVWAHDIVNVSIMGSGDVRYYGDAKVSKSVMGSGSVKRLAAAPGT